MQIPFQSSNTFSNPLLPSGADPWATKKNGWYFYTHTTYSNITLWKTRDMADLDGAERKVIWKPAGRAACSKNIWAPELHWIEDRWYLYFAADNGCNRNHRMYVLEGRGEDPLHAVWTFLGELKTPGNCWAIDATVLQRGGVLHLLWSEWEGTENGQQNIYIAKMKNPWTVTGERIPISAPTAAWERHGKLHKPGRDDKPYVMVNEGPSLLIRNRRIFLIYSASGSWTEHYALGLLWAEESADLLDPRSWHKKPGPVFRAFGSGAAATYAAGHNSFFQSPDESEDWILYHANSRPSLGWGNRSPRAQRFTWTPDGFPCFGAPAGVGQELFRPSNRRSEELPEAA